MSQLQAATQVVTGKDVIEVVKTVAGFCVVSYLLITAAYCAHGVFMRPGTVRRRLVRGLVAIGSVVAIVYVMPLFWGPIHQ